MPGDGEDNPLSPVSYYELCFKWLELALEHEITERDFWDMTLAEINRAIKSKQKRQEQEARMRASYDYILADLFGRSIARVYSSSATMPEINEVYPSLFDSKEIEEKKKEKLMELSALRFKQFTHSFNTKFKEVAKDNDE